MTGHAGQAVHVIRCFDCKNYVQHRYAKRIFIQGRERHLCLSCHENYLTKKAGG